MGNHTPQDVRVGADDNTGTHASQLTGKDLLDNISLMPVMADFLKLSAFATTLSVRGGLPAVITEAFQLSPVPFENQFQVNFTLPTRGAVTVELFDEMGRRVQTVVC